MKFGGLSALVVGAVLLASPAAAEVHLTMDNGQVSVSANNATVREILAEWSKVGQTKIVNAERVAGGPLTLQLTNISEVEALEIILRSVSGYLLAQRPVQTPNASKYNRILIVPTSNAVRAGSPAPAFSPRPVAPTRPEPEPPPEDMPDDPRPPEVTPAARPPVFNTFPQPQAQPAAPPPPPQPMPTTAPSSPTGVPVPGMTTPGPQPQPGLPSPNPQ